MNEQPSPYAALGALKSIAETLRMKAEALKFEAGDNVVRQMRADDFLYLSEQLDAQVVALEKSLDTWQEVTS